jgi:hypothetical protein
MNRAFIGKRNPSTGAALALIVLVLGVSGCGTLVHETTQKQSWTYSEEQDEMGKGAIKRASIMSRNAVSLKYPYSGSQHAKLWLRKHPRLGESVALSVERGQFLEGNLLVRFDDNVSLSFGSYEPDSGSTTTIFIGEYPRFMKYLKRSKKMKIQVSFYQEAPQIFEFDVEGLVWETSPYLL